MEVLWKMEICMRKCKEEVAWVCYLIEFLWCRPTRSPREELGPQNLGGKGCGGRCCREMFWSVGSWRAGWVWGWWADVSDKEWRRLTCGAGSYTHCTHPTPGVTTGLILPAAENLVLHRGPQPAGVSEAHFPQVVDFLWVFTAAAVRNWPSSRPVAPGSCGQLTPRWPCQPCLWECGSASLR